MPQTKKAASRAARPLRAFKEPAALKRLSKSLESAQDAVTQLQSHAGRDVSQSARDLYKEVKAFVNSARRDTTKFAKAIQRDFDELQKSVTQSARKTTGRTTAKGATRSAAGKSTRTRSAAKPAAKRSTAKRSTSTRTASKS
jgi:uncharacterized NAD-dependent epimerase/dehydratase family protein